MWATRKSFRSRTEARFVARVRVSTPHDENRDPGVDTGMRGIYIYIYSAFLSPLLPLPKPEPSPPPSLRLPLGDSGVSAESGERRRETREREREKKDTIGWRFLSSSILLHETKRNYTHTHTHDKIRAVRIKRSFGSRDRNLKGRSLHATV